MRPECFMYMQQGVACLSEALVWNSCPFEPWQRHLLLCPWSKLLWPQFPTLRNGYDDSSCLSWVWRVRQNEAGSILADSPAHCKHSGDHSCTERLVCGMRVPEASRRTCFCFSPGGGGVGEGFT